MQKQEAEIFARLSKRPTKELEQSLKDALLSGRISDREVGVLLAILEERNSKNSQSAREAAEASWEQFCERYPIEIEKAEDESTDEDEDKGAPKANPAPAKKKRLSLWQKLSALVICLCLVLAAAVIIPSGASAGQWLAKWIPTDFWFFDTTGESATFDINASDETEFDSIEDAFAAYHITEPLAPTWVPDGFELGDVSVAKHDDYVEFSFKYYCNDKYFTFGVTAYNSMDSIDSKTSKNDESPEVVTINSINHYIFTNTDFNTAKWVNACYNCTISGDVSTQELDKMLQSIYQ